MSSFRKILNLYNFSLVAKFRTYQRWYFGTPYEYVEQAVPDKGNIIDLGCGWGMFANLLAIKSQARNVYGIDLDERKIKWAQRTVGIRENIKFDVQDLKSAHIATVDALVLYDVMHHLEESVQSKVLSECHEKLSSGGKLILKENDVVPKWKLFVSHLVEMIACGFNITLSKKILFRSKDEWVNFLGQHGFEVIHKEHIKTPYGFFVPHSLFICEKKTG
jgi:2-polyprenyl-3-methyl-5-hydroxy-6-metoxy-1,4-benzoquinol methylase